MAKPGKLFIVPTPVGNLEDMTFRGVRILKESELILAEDTRVSSRLLQHYGIQNKVTSHHKFNEHGTVKNIAAKIEAGINVALISDAGTPGISDPGFLLVRTCLENNIDVECLPGATAFVPALVNSGFPTDRFIFEGFLPQKKGRQKRLSALASEKRTMILYESPFRLVKLSKKQPPGAKSWSSSKENPGKRRIWNEKDSRSIAMPGASTPTLSKCPGAHHAEKLL